MSNQTMSVDRARCIGCGACIDVCPVEAIALLDGKAHVDDARCTACGACADVCPENALQLAIRGELVPAQQPIATVRRPTPLAETAGAAVAVTGMGLLAKAAGALVRTAGRWLDRRTDTTRQPSRQTPRTASERPGGQGRQMRRRRRGRQ
jgi:ferredoxin